MYNFTEQEKQLLSNAFSKYLESIWNEADKLGSGDRYEEIVDDVCHIRLFTRDNNISLPIHIEARF